ncbi:MAG: hypothetical protein ACON5H_02500 [Akkermansiaceae bacterium]
MKAPILLPALCALAVTSVSCAPKELLSIRQFRLADVEVERDSYHRYDENQFIRGEVNKRTYGAITAKEREQRKGHYYNVNWTQLSGTDPVKVVFEYRQASTGDRVKKLTKVLSATASGSTEFQVIGADYQKNGRVLSWRISLYDGAQKVATKQSYLWD